MSRRASRIAVAAVTIIGIALSGGAARAGTQASITLDIDPTSGAAGTVISASGVCYEHDVASCDQVQLSLLDPDDVMVDSELLDLGAEPAYNGSLDVPSDAPCGEYNVLAEGIEDRQVIVAETAIFQLSVGCAPVTTTTTTTVGPTTTAAPTPAAAATVASPTLTG